MSFGENEEATESAQQISTLDSTQISQGVVYKTVPSGIPGFDAALGQGLVEGNIYLIISNSGEYSKQFVHQMLYNRIISKSPVTYYTFEDSSEDIVEEMAHANMDIQNFVNEGSWKFTRIVPEELKQIVEALPAHPLDEKITLAGDIGDLTNHFLEQMRKDCDTLMQFTHLIRTLTPLQIQQLVLYLKGSVRKFGGVHFIVLNKGGGNEDKEFVLRDLADTIFEVDTSLKMSDIEVTAIIKKARKIKPTTRKLQLVDKNGILSGSTIQRI